jgi:8-amino-7-oxononanoate synthase
MGGRLLKGLGGGKRPGAQAQGGRGMMGGRLLKGFGGGPPKKGLPVLFFPGILGAVDEWIEAELSRLDDLGLRRELQTLTTGALPRVMVGGREFLNLASNNYLGLATDPRVIEAARAAAFAYGVGAGSSRLISGHLEIHQALEAELAEFKGAEQARVFPTGYSTSVGVLTALIGKWDSIFADELIHASLIDGCRLTGAARNIYRHGDMEHLCELLGSVMPIGTRFIVTDGVFSMDGDVAPLEELVELSVRFDAVLVVDDAHGTGVLGPEGRGSVEALGLAEQVPVRIGTLSKAFGAQGGYVVGSRALGDLLLHRARSFIYSTALAPPMAGAALAAIRISRAEDWRRDSLKENARVLRDGLEALGYEFADSVDVPMVVVVLGSPKASLTLGKRLLEKGILAPAIRPPTVPKGTSRIRMTPMATHSISDMKEALAAFPPASEIEK